MVFLFNDKQLLITSIMMLVIGIFYYILGDSLQPVMTQAGPVDPQRIAHEFFLGGVIIFIIWWVKKKYGK